MCSATFPRFPTFRSVFAGARGRIGQWCWTGAAGVGLLTPLGADMYGIHPALPAYVAQQWRREEPDYYPQQRIAADAALLDAYAAVAQPLNAYWDARGLYDEARGWVDRARLALETADGTPPPVDDPAGALWLFLIGSHANRERIAYHREQLQRLVGAYHHLGWVAQDRGRLEDAAVVPPIPHHQRGARQPVRHGYVLRAVGPPR